MSLHPTSKPDPAIENTAPMDVSHPPAPDALDNSALVQEDEEMKRLEKLALAAGGPDLQGNYEKEK